VASSRCITQQRAAERLFAWTISLAGETLPGEV
jgi:hypothetical protein